MADILSVIRVSENTDEFSLHQIQRITLVIAVSLQFNVALSGIGFRSLTSVDRGDIPCIMGGSHTQSHQLHYHNYH